MSTSTELENLYATHSPLPTPQTIPGSNADLEDMISKDGSENSPGQELGLHP